MINIIVAVAKNGVIGSDGKIPWNIPDDKAYFKKVTSGNIVIMGRRTFEEIGFPLPDRYNIVVSEHRDFYGKNLTTARSLDDALDIARIYGQENNIEEIFLCGGEKIYKQGLDSAQRIYITEIDSEYTGDTFFPEFSKDEFRLYECIHTDNESLTFCIYERYDNS